MSDKKPWEQFANTQPQDTEQKPWESFSGQTKPKEAERKALSDIGNSIASGAAAAGRGILGLSDLVTGSNSIQNTKNLGLDIKSSEQAWKDNLSEKAKQEEQAWNNTQGFVDTLKYGATHPFAVVNKVAESLPAMAVSGGMGGAVAKGVIGGAIGEGMQQAGSSYADAIEKNNGNTPTDKDAGAALGSGVTTATISALSGGLAKKLGIGDIDTAIANRVAGEAATSARPLGLGAYAKNIGEGIITEGALEELPQSATEQMWQNYADDKPIMEGVPEAAAQGLITGGLMGGAFNATNLPTFNESQNNQGNQDGQGQSSGPMPEVLPPDGSNGLPNNVQPNTFDGSYRDLTPSNAPQLTNDPQPEGAPASSNNTPSSETPMPNGLGLNLLQLNNTTSETPEVQAGNLSPSQELGIDPNQGGLSSAAAVAVDTGASPITAELQRQATQSQPNEQANWLNSIASATAQNQNEAPQLGYSPSENTDTPPVQQAQVADLWNSQDPQQRMAILGRIYGNEDMARQNALASFDRLPKPAQQQIADMAVQSGAVSEDNNTQSSNGQTTQTVPQAPLTALAQDIAPASQANDAPTIEPILGKDGKNKWFATQNKADEFIQKKSLGDNYAIEQTGKMRYEIVPKAQEQTPIQEPQRTQQERRQIVIDAYNTDNNPPAGAGNYAQQKAKVTIDRVKQQSPSLYEEAKQLAENAEVATNKNNGRTAHYLTFANDDAYQADPFIGKKPSKDEIMVEALMHVTRDNAPMLPTENNAEATQPKLYGKESYIQTGSERQPTRVAVVEADSLTPDDKNTDNQFRDRTRSASQMQIDSIANNLDPRQLTDSTTMATGSPTLANDGKTIIAGNGRTKAIKQAYAQGKGAEYKQSLIEQAQSLGIDPQQIAGMKNPVLVKEFANPVDVKKMAIESNATGGLAMSAKEQARADSALMPDMSMLVSDDKGNINLSRNAHIFRKFISSLPVEAQASMLDKDGLLSKEGLSRLQNAVLYKAYGDSKTFDDMVENTDIDVKNAINGLTQVAPKIAQTKESINQGTSYDADISDDITAALSLLQQIRKNEMSVSDYLSQMGLFDDGLSPIAKEFIQYIDDNIRSAKAIADLLSAYYDNLDSLGNPNQQDLLGGKPNTDKQSLFKQALEQVRNAKQPKQTTNDLFAEPTASDAGQPTNQADNAVEQRPSQSQSDGAGAGTNESAVIKNVGDFVTGKNNKQYKITDIQYTSLGGISSISLKLADAKYKDNGKPWTLGEYTRYIKQDHVLFTPNQAGTKTSEAQQGGDSQIESLVLNSNVDDLTADERRAVERYMLGSRYGVEIGVPFAEQFNNFKAWLLDKKQANPTNTKDAIEKIQAEKKAAKKDKEKFADNKVFTADKVAAARARMKSKLSQINSGIDPEMVMDGITITGAYVESGIRKFSDYANAMIEDFGDSIKPYLLSFWESTRHYPSGVDVSGMTSVEDSKKEFDALIKPQDLQTDAIGDKTPQSPAKQPTKKAKQSKGEMTLTDYWGVEYIDGWSETDKYKGEYSDYGVIGGVKDAFLKEAKTYLTTVADVLSQHGYDVYKDRKGKPDKAVDVNKSGTAGSGEVGLTMQNPVTDQRIYVKIGATSMRGIIPTTSNGVSVMYRTYVGGDRFGGGSNQWAQTDLTADELAQLLIEKAGRELERQQPKGQLDDNSLRGTPDGRASATTATGETSQGTLARVSTDDVSPVSKTGNTTGQAQPSSRTSVSSDGTTGRSGAQSERSAGNRPAAVYPATTRDERVTPEPTQAVTADNTATDYPIAPPQTQGNSQDFTISEDDEVGKGGLKTKFKQNLEAIKLLKQLQSENRQATKDEQKILTKWVGWGGLKAAFRRGDGSTVNGWAKEVEQLEALLTPDELDAALNSTIAAHYTEPKIVKAMWKAVEKLGFNGGRVLEPSIGSGIFLGMLPASLRKSTAFYGTELDTITGGLAQQLYPTAAIKVMGFQDYSLQDGFFKVAIGNPPFANIKITDLERKHLNGLSLHNYFFAKSLDALEDNGVLAMVVTSRLLDGADPKTRNYLFDNAELLMAVRLPNNAFKENANTDVTTDIIFLRKRSEAERVNGITNDFDYRGVGKFTDKNGDVVPLNNYFVKNPDHMLGEFGNFGTMYARGTDGIETALVAPKGQNTLDLLNKVLDKLPTGVITPRNKSDILIVESMVKDIPDVKVGSMFEQDGNIYERTPDSMGDRQAVAVELPSQKAVERVKGLIGLRTLLSDVRQMQLSSNTDETVLEQRRAELNKAYDQFVKEHGHINSDANKRLFKEDPSWSQLSALEDNYDKGVSAAVSKNTGEPVKKPSAKKAAILERRTQYPFAEVTQVSSAKDGMIETLNSVGRLDLARISQLYGKNEQSVIKELGDLVYQDPVQGWVTADNYLSGNVKAKLAQAKEAMAQYGSEYERNVKALEQVQPQDIEAVDIEVRPGAHWIPANHITDFLKDVLGATGLQGVPTYSKFDNDWTLPKFSESAEAGTQFGTSRKLVRDIVTAAMNGKQITVHDQIDRDTRVVNQEATNDANQKVEAVKRAWNDWIWMDDGRRDELARLYNDIFNTDVAQAYDGSHLKLLGKVDDNVIDLRPTQKNAIWRITQNPTTLLDHVVGAGKTFTMVAAAMELRRMGLASKPMIVVPNHLVSQWGKEFIQLYSNANILVATKKDFEATNRKRLVARIANGDWDAVIVAHSSFGKIAVSPEFEAEFIKQQIQEISDAIEQAKQEAGKSSNARDLANRKLKLEEKYKKLTASESRDTDNLYWDELGVDALMLDEAHEFKNLAYTTSSMNRVAGLGNQAGSQKAMDLFMKIQQLKQNPSSRIVFATGTPISNSMAEMYTMQRYLDMERMQNQGISGFDAWAKTFGEVINDWELSASGKYQMKSRFAKFVNMPELMQSYLGFADVINRDDINDSLKSQGKKLPVPKIKGGAPQNTVVERSDEQADFIGVPRMRDGREIYDEHTLIYRAEHLPKGQDAKKKGADNMLKIMGEARKAALDMRILEPNAPDFAGSKINVAVGNIMRIWRDTAADKGTQLVFCDLSTPKGSNNKEQAKLNELVRLADEGNEDAIAQLEKYTPDELDAIMNVNSFSVYDDIKQKLINQGIPENEIAFIHDANTELQKDELFSKVRSGRVRVLLGSTSKMGAGTNVQTRLVALHHMDAPWRPSDLEQREGRIIRQGNELYAKDPENFEVEIHRYATEQTMDAMQWQIIENKAKFIEQVRKGDIKTRVIEDIEGEAANAGAMKAAASGNPLILEEMALKKQLNDLDSDKTRHDREQHRIKATIKRTKDGIDSLDNEQSRYTTLSQAKTPAEFDITVNGKNYKQGQEGARTDAGKAIISQAIKASMSKNKLTVGQYGDFTIYAAANPTNRDSAIISLGYQGESISIEVKHNDPAGGIITKLINRIKEIPDKLQQFKTDLEKSIKAIPKLESQLKPWGKETELDAIRQKHADVMDALKPKKDGQPQQNQQYSQAGTRIGSTSKQVRQVLSDKFGKATIDKLIADGNLEIIDYAEAKRRNPKTPSNADGYYQNGKATLIADNLSPDMIIPTFLHELGGHGGLQTLMSDKAYQSLLKKFDRMVAEGNPLASEAKAFADATSPNAKVAQDEYLPYLISLAARAQGNSKVKSMLNRIVMAIKSFMRDKFGVNLKITPADIVALAEKMVSERATQSNVTASMPAQYSKQTPQTEIDQVRQQHEGTEQWMKAPNGNPTNLTERQWLQVRTPSFKAWFGDWENDSDYSEIIDDNGEPLVVYHATSDDFNVFDRSLLGGSTYGNASQLAYGMTAGLGFWFNSENLQETQDYGDRAIASFLNIRNSKQYDSIRDIADDIAYSGVIPDGKDSVYDFDDTSEINALVDEFLEPLRENDYDGFVVDDEEYGGVSYVALDPNQIKSATDNIGTFNPENDDIRYSQMGGNAPQVNKLSKALSEFLKNPLSFIKAASDNKVTDNLGKALALLGRRQIVDIYKKDLPPIKEYSDIVEQMDADSNEKAYEADKLVKEWGKLKDELPLAELMHDATLKGIDPAEAYQAGDDRAIYQQLRRRYDALSPDAKRIYKQARDDYKAQQRSVFEAIKGRIQRTDMSAPRQAELIRKMEQGFFFGQKVYFPLARFGNYVVAVKDAAGNIVSVSRAETQAQANQLRKELIAQYPNDKVGRVMLDKEFVSSRDGVTRGFMSDLFDAVDKLNISSQERAEFEDTLGQLYLNSLPDISFAKSGMHRKGTAGFSQNARRAYAQHMSRGSHYIAKMRHSDVLQAKLDEMQEYVKAQGEADPNYDQPKMQRVVDEMEKRHESLMNNHTAGWSSLATSVGFMWYMGLSPASALVNLSQTALVAYPIMGAKWGFAKASKELLIASGQASKALNNLQSSLSGDEKTAFDEAVKRGVIDMTQAHDLAGVARGEDDSVMWKIRKPMEWASFMFHHAEKFNRQVTFIASYRLAKQAGANHKQAIEQAIDATYEGHFSYAASNRPRIMQGDWARVFLLFKQYGQNMVYTLTRNAYLSAKGDKQAMKTLAGILALHGTFAGVLGLPLATTLLGFASALGGDDDEPWNAEIALRNYLAELLGDGASEVISKGLPRALGIDLSSRVGLDSLILPRMQEGLEGQRAGESFTAAMTGPVAGIGVNAIAGFSDIQKAVTPNEYLIGTEKLLPKAFRDLMKTYRLAAYGNVDKTGVEIVPQENISLSDVGQQALGFRSGKIAQAQEGKSAIYKMDKEIGSKRQRLMNRYAKAYMAGDTIAADEAWQDIKRFNAGIGKDYPKLKITKPKLMQSIKQRRRRIEDAEDGIYLPSSREASRQYGSFATE